MSLRDFERAMCDLIASPDLCLRLRQNAREALGTYDLTPRERRRLTSVVWQRGMSVNCTLYRVNRITPVYTLLPYTCTLLGNDLLREMQIFWAEFRDTELQYLTEIRRFAAFLRGRIDRGHHPQDFLSDVLELEMAANELRFAPRRRILADLEARSRSTDRSCLRAHPLVRALSFRRDPEIVLHSLAEGRHPPSDCPAGDFFLLLDGRGDELSFSSLSPRLARQLLSASATRLSPAECSELIGSGEDGSVS